MPKFAANLSMLFTEAPFLDRFSAARQAGFTGVEYLFPYEYDAVELRRRLDDNGLTQVLHNLPAGDWAAGERGVAVLPERKQEFRDGVARGVEYATQLGCRQVNCLVGLTPAGPAPELSEETLIDNLGYAARELEREGIRLLIEPVNTNDIPGFHLNRTAQAVGLIEAVGSGNLFIQYDAYHMQIMEGDLARTIERNLERIAHIQLADNPGRHEPGTGEINYSFLFGFLDAVGYDGWIGCEYKPAARTDAGLGWMARALGGAGEPVLLKAGAR